MQPFWGAMESTIAASYDIMMFLLGVYSRDPHISAKDTWVRMLFTASIVWDMESDQ